MTVPFTPNHLIYPRASPPFTTRTSPWSYFFPFRFGSKLWHFSHSGCWQKLFYFHVIRIKYTDWWFRSPGLTMRIYFFIVLVFYMYYDGHQQKLFAQHCLHMFAYLSLLLPFFFQYILESIEFSAFLSIIQSPSWSSLFLLHTFPLIISLPPPSPIHNSSLGFW